MTVFDYSYIMGGGASGGTNGSIDVMALFFYRMAFGDNNRWAERSAPTLWEWVLPLPVYCLQ